MIRGKKISKQDNKVNIDLNMGIHNRFDVEVVDAESGEIRQKAVGYNVICDALWTKLLTPTTYFNYIHYGTGTGTPVAADTSLFTFLGYGSIITDSDVCDVDEDTGIGYVRRKVQLAPETAVGSTITEVGIAYSTSSNTLCTHAMLQDMNGNPISILKTATDLINIYATVYCHFSPTGYMNSSVFLGGSRQNMAFIKSICGMYTSEGWPNYALGYEAWGTFNKGITSDTVSVSKAYDATNKRMTLTVGRFAVSSNNRPLQEILLFAYNYTGGSYGGASHGPCVLLKPGRTGGWFPPHSITAEALGTGDGETTVFNTAFPFATDATVYVDGVAMTSGVTVTSGLNQCSYPNRYISCIKASSTVSNVLPSCHDVSGYRNGSYDTSANSELYVTTGRWYYFYNPVASSVPVTKAYAPYCILEASQDMTTWVTVNTFSGTETFNIPSQYQNYPFWREKRTSNYSPSWGNSNHYGSFTMAATGGNVTFDTPPATGSVITIDYTTSVIPKDTNHVLDITITVQFGEYTED